MVLFAPFFTNFGSDLTRVAISDRKRQYQIVILAPKPSETMPNLILYVQLLMI